MYDMPTRRYANELVTEGLSLNEVSRQTGISRATIREWQTRIEPLRLSAVCPRCASIPTLPEPLPDYAYLLGLYLGDGCISKAPKLGIWIMRIACANAWPGLQEECKRALLAIRPTNKICSVVQQGCTAIASYSKHWPCLFPQHGPGKKHTRKIALEGWQQNIVAQHPREFLRGLFHSDGCRITNNVRHQLPSGERWYSYPRYLFVNESVDIRELCGQTLDLLNIAWRYSKKNTISVAKRDAVTAMEEFIGPKY